MTEVFHMIPASSKALWFLGAFGLLLAGMLGLFGFIAYSTRNVRFEVSDTGIRIVGDLYGRTIPADALVLAEARPVDLTKERELRPRIRTGGMGLPGYRAGWFRLRNGDKALLYLTDVRHAVYVPTREGYALLLSVADPAAFLETLRRTWGSN